MDLSNDVFRIKLKEEFPFEQVRAVVKAIKDGQYDAEPARESDFKNDVVNLRGPTPEFLKPYLEKAKSENKYVLAICSAAWCAACKKLHRAVENSPEIQQLLQEKFIVAEIDLDKATDLKNWLGTNAVPDT